MTKIGNAILNAIYRQTPFNKANTVIEWDASEATVRFFGIKIATVFKADDDWFVKVCLQDSWGDKTTIDRINTLLSVAMQEPRLHIKRGDLVIKWLNGTTEPFTNGRKFQLKYGAIN
jgi:hypothetical protein